MDSGRRNDKHVKKMRQVFRGHRSNAINNDGNTVGLTYVTHRNHGLKQEADCCKIRLSWWRTINTPTSNIRLKQAHTPFLQFTTGDEIWVCGYDPQAINIAAIKKWTEGGVGQKPEPRVEMPRTVGEAQARCMNSSRGRRRPVATAALKLLQCFSPENFGSHITKSCWNTKFLAEFGPILLHF
jgi:hypothetical protein